MHSTTDGVTDAIKVNLAELRALTLRFETLLDGNPPPMHLCRAAVALEDATAGLRRTVALLEPQTEEDA